MTAGIRPQQPNSSGCYGESISTSADRGERRGVGGHLRRPDSADVRRRLRV